VTRLWDHGAPLDAAVLRLTAGRDPQLDLHLVAWDCLASAAHARMLEAIGVLEESERRALEDELVRLADEAREGRFSIALDDEDGHTAIENRLVERVGEAGRKIHTGRSRNDQVLAALRLWGRALVLDQVGALLGVVDELAGLAETHRAVTMPGYSHTRQAMPTTLGHALSAWAEGLLDDVPWLRTAYAHLDRSPLGSASGFGVPLPLDRQQVARLLGFGALQHNTLAVQNDRGKSEYLALAAAAAVATDLGRLAADLIWWSSDELRFVRLPQSVTTGSSLMPQKRNPDLLELIRAGAARLRGRQAEVAGVYGGLGAGYHRDLQLTKQPFLEGMQELCDLLVGCELILGGLEVDAERCREAVLPATGATDALFARIGEGRAFRDAYREAAAGDGAASAPPEAWERRASAGAPGDPELLAPLERRREERVWLSLQREHVAAATAWFGA
jgi:argininosuccinate lyase